MFISLCFWYHDGIKASAFGDNAGTESRLPLAERGLAWLVPTVVMVIGDYLGSRGSAGDLQRSLKSLTYVYTTGLNARGFVC